MTRSVRGIVLAATLALVWGLVPAGGSATANAPSDVQPAPMALADVDLAWSATPPGGAGIELAVAVAPGSIEAAASPSATVVTAPWLSAEAYFLRLMNCTRRGGWVTSIGGCLHPGVRKVAPLVLDASISTRATRPYARILATAGVCSHFYGTSPATRLRRAGFPSYNWAENIGCPYGSVMKGMLASQLFFQSEKSYNGGHYRNLMNAVYTKVGIGAWSYGGRVRVVIDFYRP